MENNKQRSQSINLAFNEEWSGLQSRNVEDLNLLDDFLMYSMASSKTYGVEFCKEILTTILGTEFKSITIIPQKVFYGIDLETHGARLDVYVDEQDDGTRNGAIYDIEPEKRSGKKSELPQRVRFYHAKIDGAALEKGEDYKSLKKVYVIFITPFDPFDRNQMVYTIKNSCVEEPDMPYDDGARTIYLYTKGTAGNPSKKLADLLRYIEETTDDNATSDQLKKIQGMVKEVKADKEVKGMYLKIWEREDELLRQIRQSKEETQRILEREQKAREETQRIREREQKAREETQRILEREQKAREETQRILEREQKAREAAEQERKRADALEERIRELEKQQREE